MHENWALMPWVDLNYCRLCFQGTNQRHRPGSFIITFASKYVMIIQNICIFQPSSSSPQTDKREKRAVIWGQKVFIGLVNADEYVSYIGSESRWTDLRSL